MKTDCYKCQYRGEIPGDAHIRCNHPEVVQEDNPFGAMVDLIKGTNREIQRKLNIRGNPVGIRRGWFLWPANFDPVWLENCDGFKAIEKRESSHGPALTSP